MAPDRDDADQWLDPNDDMGLWEHQGHPLTVRWLASALAEAGDPDLPVTIDYHDGTGWRELSVVHIDMKGAEGRPTALVFTVASLV
jgi:hypothetical protein